MPKIRFLLLLTISIAIINIGCEEDLTEPGGNGGETEVPTEKQDEKLSARERIKLDTILTKTAAFTADDRKKLIDAVSKGSLAGIEDNLLDKFVSEINGLEIDELDAAEMQTLLELLVNNGLKIQNIDEVSDLQKALTTLEKNLDTGIMNAMQENLDKIKASTLSTAKDALKKLVDAKSLEEAGNTATINTDLATIRKAVVDALNDDKEKTALQKLAGQLLSVRTWITGELEITLEEIRDNGWVKEELQSETLLEKLKDLTKDTVATTDAETIRSINDELAKVITDVSNLKETAKTELRNALTPFADGGEKAITSILLPEAGTTDTNKVSALNDLKSHVTTILPKLELLTDEQKRELKAILTKATALKDDEKDKLIDAISKGSFAGILEELTKFIAEIKGLHVTVLDTEKAKTLLELLVKKALRIKDIDTVPSVTIKGETFTLRGVLEALETRLNRKMI